MKQLKIAVTILSMILIAFLGGIEIGQGTATYHTVAATATITFNSTAIIEHTKYVYFNSLVLRNMPINSSMASLMYNYTENIFLAHELGLNASANIYISSYGGLYDSSTLIGSYLDRLRLAGVTVNLFVIGPCLSGCFLISTYASDVYLAQNASYGFHHLPSEYSAKEWHEFAATIAHNKGWTIDYTLSIMPLTFSAEQAVNQGIATGFMD